MTWYASSILRFLLSVGALSMMVQVKLCVGYCTRSFDGSDFSAFEFWLFPSNGSVSHCFPNLCCVANTFPLSIILLLWFNLFLVGKRDRCFPSVNNLYFIRSKEFDSVDDIFYFPFVLGAKRNLDENLTSLFEEPRWYNRLLSRRHIRSYLSLDEMYLNLTLSSYQLQNYRLSLVVLIYLLFVTFYRKRSTFQNV